MTKLPDIQTFRIRAKCFRDRLQKEILDNILNMCSVFMGFTGDTCNVKVDKHCQNIWHIIECLEGTQRKKFRKAMENEMLDTKHNGSTFHNKNLLIKWEGQCVLCVCELVLFMLGFV